ncbi:MAG TPA: Glu/Leu/Phe/Val dehydrogenase dimerization domain-containing protein [Gammaproteobacteria bacterium]|nr:Glu/Leu/Phe/Val dehydrogenase dimerization domain-containing protein [Gammaproteobacteria bacterium]
MELFDILEEKGHEEVVFFHSQSTGMKCIVAIHSTVLGPALGGLRMWPYATEDEALKDVLRLSRGMTYKASVSGLNLGGGKAVLIGDPEKDKSEALFRALGRFIGSLGNRYITAEDVGTTVEDMDYIFQETDRVVGVHKVHGGSGDPSPFTAYGTMQGIKACLERRYGHTDVGQASYAVQGVGSVGHHLVRLLRRHGAKVFVTDINAERVQQTVDELGAEAVPMNQIYDTDAKVFAPCALGGVVNEDTVPRLKCEIVAGAANNQLESDEWGTALEKRGILYAPDYAINAGGLMNVAIELQGYNKERAYLAVSSIYINIRNIFNIADRDGIPSWQAADRLAEERIRAIGEVKKPYSKRFKDRLSGRSPHTAAD